MTTSIIPITAPDQVIVHVRGHAVILDRDLAALYGATTKRLNEQVKRNQKRFPEDFVFQLTRKEAQSLRSQNATLKRGQHRKYLPYAFTEHGAIMAANVLESERAMQMSVAVVRAFVRLRQMALSVKELTRKVDELEKGFRQHGQQFETVFEAIRELMKPPEPPKKSLIGFHVRDEDEGKARLRGLKAKSRLRS